MAMELYASVAAYLTDSWRVVPSRRERAMEAPTTDRRNRDYSKGPVWDAAKSRWLVEIRYPDGSRFRKRMRREREAIRLCLRAIPRVLEGSAPLAQQLRGSCANALGRASRAADAPREDHFAASRRL